MDPCTEALSRAWLATLAKFAPQTVGRARANEQLMLAQDRTEGNLREMVQRREKLEKQVLQISSDARAHLARGDQRSARVAIARRRRVTAQLNQVCDLIISLEATLDGYATSETTAAIIAAFKTSNSAISAWRKHAPSADDADAIRQDLDEYIQAANEITQIVSQPVQTLDAAVGDLTTEDMLRELDADDDPPAVIASKAERFTQPPDHASAMHLITEQDDPAEEDDERMRLLSA